jgi:hypothetical protein
MDLNVPSTVENYRGHLTVACKGQRWIGARAYVLSTISWAQATAAESVTFVFSLDGVTS